MVCIYRGMMQARIRADGIRAMDAFLGARIAA
jgi:hypothetical protein